MTFHTWTIKIVDKQKCFSRNTDL